jgi:anti-sigma regulatory factor (Ser/Thr protein kinase)
VVDRLRRGEDVDVQAESPAPPTSNIREISLIARSFGTVQEAAIAAAVDQAQLRKGVNQVFLNISMRNQSLLHRQLGMLDSMERRTSDPAALADLFRLDHLTTRMRRHAEGLIILSGSTPGRGWREPVPALDVLRAAIAEVEDYVRVDVLSESRDLVAGNAVNDVIHLVAELVENAAVFSPPNTRIEVRADRAGTGLVVEIEDRGLGLSDEELIEINERLAKPPEFDPANSEQLGLFVVSRLAVRQNIKVALRQSVYGGTTAILVMPFGVIVRDEDARDGGWEDEDGPVFPPDASGIATSEPPSLATGLRGGPPLDVAGRHRFPSAATGRRVETGAPAVQPWELADVAPWPAAWRRESAADEPTRPTLPRKQDGGGLATPAGSMRDREPASLASSGSHLGMPIRVPQASLAPELRGRRDTGAQAPVRDTSDIDERPPEAIRNVMTEMQQGWQRGRLDDLDDPEGAPTMELTDSEAENGTD